MTERHRSVLLQEVIDLLEPCENESFIDATVGFGGHAEAILEQNGPKGLLYGIDQDQEALKQAGEKLASFGQRFKPTLGNFREIAALVPEKVTGGILADLGASSYQFDVRERGFSFGSDRLDMRMNQKATLTARDVVNDYSREDLAEIIRVYGDERWAKRIAGRIVEKREGKKINSARELSEIVSAAIPRKFWPKRINPATKTFQAIRIEVNQELDSLKDFLPAALELLLPGAKLAVISFHSGEDRLVKEFARTMTKTCSCPPESPKCCCGGRAKAKLITRKAIKPSEKEISKNPRSRSAKLRVIEKI